MHAALAGVGRIQAQPGECPNQSLDSASKGSNPCTIDSDCSWIACPFGSEGQLNEASLVVSKCTDPLKMTLTVSGPDYAFKEDFTSSRSVTNNGATFSLTTSRNASYVDVQVSTCTAL